MIDNGFQIKRRIKMPKSKSRIGALIVEGKTKSLFASTKEPHVGFAVSKDVVTWKDLYSMPMPGKGVWATTVNHCLCTLFRRAGLPVAYLDQEDERTFATEICSMLPYEVVACGIVDKDSSYHKRNPGIPAETQFTEAVIQVHLKTSSRSHAGITLPCDDPLMVFEGDEVSLYLPGKPINEQEPIFTISLAGAKDVFPGIEHIPAMRTLTQKAFSVTRKAYNQVGGRLYDGKWEVGIARWGPFKGRLVIADVFDADSMRLTVNGRRADKQPIRNGGEAAFDEQVAAYLLAVETSNKLTM
jgi:phosphoribosylaminoimidazole-succinocarboxamide synthase